MNQYMLRVHIKSNAVTLNNKSGGTCGKFSEDYPKCGRFYKTIKNYIINAGDSQTMLANYNVWP